MRRLDLTNQRFGKLTAIGVDPLSKQVRQWTCLCDCGHTVSIRTSQLTSGNNKSCGCLQKEDLSGLTFHYLVVKSKSYLKKSRQHYVCQCQCGREVLVANSKLKNGHTKSCGCLKTDPSLGNKACRKEYGESTRNRIVNNYKSGARKRGLVFELSNEQVFALLENHCFYCGKPPSTTSSRPRLYGEYTHNGIDRLDNAVGYTTENCVSCCMECNYKKGAQHVDDFVTWVMRVANNLSKAKKPVDVHYPDGQVVTL